MNIGKESGMFFKLLKVLSALLIFTFVIGMIPIYSAYAAKKSYTVFEQYDDGYSLVKNGEKYGVVNKNGRITIPIKYDNISRETYKGYFVDAFFVNNGEKWGIANKNGKFLIPVFYDDIQQYDKGLYKVVKKDGSGNEKYGIINRKKFFCLLSIMK